MDALFIAINAKYIHTNNAVRLLKANSLFDIDILDFTIKDSIDTIYTSIKELNPSIVGFSTYIWNVDMVTNLTKLIKESTNIKVVLGGPEVSYDPLYFLDTTKADVVVKGEGEHIINDILTSLKVNSSLKTINNVSTYENNEFINNPIKEIADLSSLNSPYYFTEDIPHIKNKIAYIETSRGCPYKCSYCLSSLEKKVRFFDIETVKSDILYLLKNGAKTFKFLDRTFNASKHIIPILDFIIKNHIEGTVFQFEITGDVLNPKVIDYIHNHAPKGLFRFEIGIQSTNEETNLLVDRFQNNEILFSNIKKIQDQDVIDLHLDLIAGLPKEDLISFKNTFNMVYLLGAKELQLGFLKMLRGTKIRNQAALYGYLYDNDAPYEIKSNDVLSACDKEIIKQVEKTLNIFHNKGFFNDLLFEIVKEHFSPFDFFYQLYIYMKTNNVPFVRYQIDQIYHVLSRFLQNEGINESVLIQLKITYLLRAKVKPKCYFDLVIDKEAKAYCFEKLLTTYGIPIDKLYKHTVLFEDESTYHCAYYQKQTAHYYAVKKGCH
jgi:anaerobic magnesium-protoporphyrin IX monomethyl ester cyclase